MQISYPRSCENERKYWVSLILFHILLINLVICWLDKYTTKVYLFSRNILFARNRDDIDSHELGVRCRFGQRHNILMSMVLELNSERGYNTLVELLTSTTLICVIIRNHNLTWAMEMDVWKLVKCKSDQRMKGSEQTFYLLQINKIHIQFL